MFFLYDIDSVKFSLVPFAVLLFVTSSSFSFKKHETHPGFSITGVLELQFFNCK